MRRAPSARPISPPTSSLPPRRSPPRAHVRKGLPTGRRRRAATPRPPDATSRCVSWRSLGVRSNARSASSPKRAPPPMPRAAPPRAPAPPRRRRRSTGARSSWRTARRRRRSAAIWRARSATTGRRPISTPSPHRWRYAAHNGSRSRPRSPRSRPHGKQPWRRARRGVRPSPAPRKRRARRERALAGDDLTATAAAAERALAQYRSAAAAAELARHLHEADEALARVESRRTQALEAGADGDRAATSFAAAERLRRRGDRKPATRRLARGAGARRVRGGALRGKRRANSRDAVRADALAAKTAAEKAGVQRQELADAERAEREAGEQLANGAAGAAARAYREAAERYASAGEASARRCRGSAAPGDGGTARRREGGGGAFRERSLYERHTAIHGRRERSPRRALRNGGERFRGKRADVRRGDDERRDGTPSRGGDDLPRRGRGRTRARASAPALPISPATPWQQPGERSPTPRAPSRTATSLLPSGRFKPRPRLSPRSSARVRRRAPRAKRAPPPIAPRDCGRRGALRRAGCASGGVCAGPMAPSMKVPSALAQGDFARATAAFDRASEILESFPAATAPCAARSAPGSRGAPSQVMRRDGDGGGAATVMGEAAAPTRWAMSVARRR